MNGSSYPDAEVRVPERTGLTVTAALCWWDERPEDLVECVRGMANVADRVVALDGAYRRYPDATPQSPPEQAEAIRETAKEVGLECVVLTPDRLWAGQVEKRSYLLAMASVGSDWIVVVDADHVIHADRASVRAELANFSPEVDVITAPYYTPMSERGLGNSAATGWHRRIAGHREDVAFFFRALPGLRVEGFHWFYSGIKNGKRVWVLHNDDGPGLPRYRFRSFYEVEHRTLFRDERHILAGRAFCNDRVMVVDRTGQEDDMPNLPRPVFDYVSVPY